MQIPKTGKALQADVENLEYVAKPIFEDFLYENTVTMIAADPGVGKSVVVMNLSLCACSGSMLWDKFVIDRPRRVYYLQLEGAYAEAVERMRYMAQVVPIDYSNICWDNCEGINVFKQADIDMIMARIAAWGKVDIIVIDPIYMAVSGGLSKDEPATAFVKFSNALRDKFGATVILVHHTHRAHYQDGQKVEEDDPFYGSQWLKAHVDVSYYLKARDDKGTKSVLVNKKSRGANVQKNIPLIYDGETMTCRYDGVCHGDSAIDRVIAKLGELKMQGKDTNLHELSEMAHLSMAHLKRIKMSHLLDEHVEFVKLPANKLLWKPK